MISLLLYIPWKLLSAIRGNKTKELIRIPMIKELQIMLLRGILYIVFFPGYGIFFLLQPVYKRPEGEIPVFVYKMDFCRRHTDGAGAPLRHILGRKKLAENSQRIQDNQKHHTDHSQLMLSEFPPHQLPLGFHISGFFRG